MRLEPDKIISHYRLVEHIGSGGMGIVWSAVDTRLKRHVAIKILPPDLVADDERRLRFQREAETAASLSHPNIAVIHEVGEQDGAPFLVMELLSGKTLRDAVGKRALPAREWLKYALPIASALAHAHKSGIVHRDLKSSNIMVTDDGHVKLLDFGLAKVLEPDSLPADSADVHSRMETVSRELTRAGSVLGTVAYMSPEQARGDAVDHRSDIFSFGVLLYELASGQFPFSGKTDIESLSATLATDPQPLGEVIPDVPLEADRIVTKALEKEPGRRYQHAEDMITDFRNLERDIDTGRVKILGDDSRMTATAGSPSPAAPRKGFRPWMGIASAAVVIATVFGLLQMRGGSGTDDGEPAATGRIETPATPSTSAPAAVNETADTKRIVVLPFENQGAAEDEFFALGVTEEIIGRLSAVRDLAVISRSSAFHYEREGKTMQQIGADFDVDYILDGTVRWARSGGASRVRISPQLVRVSDDTGVWGERYDAAMDDIFQVQTSIAGKVIEALDVVLLAGERETLEARPTEDQEAYQAYLRGMDALAKTPMADLPRQMLARAVELDPSFHQAWAGLSRAHSWRHHGGDRTTGQCDAAKRAADEALRLAPNSPEARMALGLYYYRCFRDYNRGLAEIAIAGRDRPNDTEVLSWRATLNKRMGNLEEAKRLNRRVMELDPMRFSSANEMAVCHWLSREHEESIAMYSRSISIAPDLPHAYAQRARTHIDLKGALDEARASLDAMPDTKLPFLRVRRFWLEYYSGRHADALSIIEDFPMTITDQTTLHPRPMMEALCAEAAGKPAQGLWEQAEELLSAQVERNPEDFRAYSDLGPVLAKLGRKDEAIAAAKRAVELMPPNKDAEANVVPANNLALVHFLVEDYETAFTLVEERLQAVPGMLTTHFIRVDPRWRKLVDHPRFTELASRFDNS